MYWTITEIIRESNLMQRSKVIKHFIKIASKEIGVYIKEIFIDFLLCRML